MTKLTRENPIINCSAVVQIGIWARPQSVLGTGTFHGAGRQMASEFFRLCVNVSHALTVITTLTLYKYIFFQRRMNPEAWWGGKFLELWKCGSGFSRLYLPTNPPDSQLEYDWSDLNGSVPLALENILHREYIGNHKHLRDCPSRCCVFTTYAEHLSLIKMYRVIITFTHQQTTNSEHWIDKKGHAIKLGKCISGLQGIHNLIKLIWHRCMEHYVKSNI